MLHEKYLELQVYSKFSFATNHAKTLQPRCTIYLMDKCKTMECRANTELSNVGKGWNDEGCLPSGPVAGDGHRVLYYTCRGCYHV